MLKIPQGECSREVQSIFIIIFHKHGNDNTLMQENPREKTQVIMGSWCPSVIVGMQGKLTLVKGWAWGTGMNLKEFTEMPAPEVYKCMSLLRESMLVQCKQFFCLHWPEQRTADSTSYQHGQFMGNVMRCGWNMTPPRPLPEVAKLQNSVLSQGGIVSF